MVMALFKKRKRLVTHNGSFHADDIFACATLELVLEKQHQKFEVSRTRDTEIIKNGDYVFDVGGIYDEASNRFDHHQKGGAGRRDNGIEYSSFGLVWKKFGKELCGSEEVVKMIDNKLAATIDAADNGFDLMESKHAISPYLIQNFFQAMQPSQNEENEEMDKVFLEMVLIAKNLLKKEIFHAEESNLFLKETTSLYEEAKDKRIIVLNSSFHDEFVLSGFPDLLFVIYQRKSDGLWGVRAVREDPKNFKNRKDFPSAWGGLVGEELQKITGVADALFCHRALFLAVAKSKEGAIKLAELALAF